MRLLAAIPSASFRIRKSKPDLELMLPEPSAAEPPPKWFPAFPTVLRPWRPCVRQFPSLHPSREVPGTQGEGVADTAIGVPSPLPLACTRSQSMSGFFGCELA